MIRTLLFPLFTLCLFIAFYLVELPSFDKEISSLVQVEPLGEKLSTSKILSQLLVILPQLLQACIWLFAAWLTNRLINLFFLEKRVFPKLLKDLVAVIIFIMAISGIMVITFGQSITGIWATSGVGIAVLGFALKNVILDSFIGISINLDKQYKIGDFVGIHTNRNLELNIRGYITEISWRTTRIKCQSRDNNF